MSDHDADLRRYAALSDRLALGEELAPDEHAFLVRMQHKDEACRLEAELIASLGELDGPPSERTRALVDAALAHVGKGHEKSVASPGARSYGGARSGATRWRVLGGAVAIAAAALVAIALRGREGKPAPVAPRVELVYLSGEVTIGGAPAAGSSSLLREGDVLAVKSGGACIAMDPEIDVCADTGTRLRLTGTTTPLRRLDLLEGKVAIQLAAQPEGSRLSIVSDGVWSTAVGTAFTVERDAQRGVRTTVLHGKVRVGEHEAKSKLVSAHQRAVTRSGGDARETEIVAISRSDESPEWALLAPTKLWNAAVAATLEISGAPAGAQVTLDGQAIGVAPLSTLVPAGTRLIDVRVNGGVLWSRQVVLTAGARETISLAGVELKAAPPAPAPAEPALAPAAPARATTGKARAASDGAELLREARKLLRDGAFAAAAAKYQELVRAHPGSAEARSSLLSLAELQLERLGDAGLALSYADRYLATGGGSLAPEARETRIRALRSLGRRAEERSAIEEYLRAHPDSLRAAALAERLSELRGGGAREPRAPSSDIP